MSGGKTISTRGVRPVTSVAPIDWKALPVNVDELLDATSRPLMQDGDFLTPEQMDASHRAAAAESDAAMRAYLNKSVAQNGQRLDKGVNQLLAAVKPLPTLLESPLTGRYGGFTDLSRESRQISDAIQQRQNALNAAIGPQFVSVDPQAETAREANAQRFRTDIGLATGGPVFTGLATGARLFGAPNDVVDNLAVSQAGLVGALGGMPESRGIKPVDQSIPSGAYTSLLQNGSKADAREYLRSNEGWLSNEQQNTILKQLSKGRVDSASITYLNETGGARLYLERAGAVSGYQRLSFNITPNGSVQKMVQTAFDNNGVLVRQRPDAAKNNLYDVKK